MANNVVVSKDNEVKTVRERPAYSTDPKTRRETVDVMEAKERATFNSYFSMLMKLYLNKNPKFKHDGQRVEELLKWAKKFRDGFPSPQNDRIRNRVSSRLASCAEAIANRIVSLAKARSGKDIGKIDAD